MIETWFSDEIDDTQLAELVVFCERAFADREKPAHVNMAADRKDSRTLLHILMEEKQFRKGFGGLCVKREGSEIIGLSGFYRSDFSPYVWAMGVRTWVLKEHRQAFTMSQHLFPHMWSLAQQQGAKLGYWTFNSYNKKYYEAFSQIRRYAFSFYEDMTFLPYPVQIRNVEQWVCYKKTDSDFKFDWASLKVEQNENV